MISIGFPKIPFNFVIVSSSVTLSSYRVSFAKEGYSLVLDEDEMMEKHNLLERLFELRSKKSELIKNMTNSEMKNGVDAILNVIMKSINKK